MRARNFQCCLSWLLFGSAFTLGAEQAGACRDKKLQKANQAELKLSLIPLPPKKEKARTLDGGRLTAASIQGQNEDKEKRSSLIDLTKKNQRPCMEAAWRRPPSKVRKKKRKKERMCEREREKDRERE